MTFVQCQIAGLAEMKKEQRKPLWLKRNPINGGEVANCAK
jgi:hypothetical protein